MRLAVVAWAVAALLTTGSAAGFEFDYTVTTSKSVDEALDAIKAAARAEGLKVPGVHNLPGPGDYVLIELCDAEKARQVLATDPKLGLLFPCGRVGVYEDVQDGGKTKISLLLPSAMVRIHPSELVWEMAKELRPRLEKVVNLAR